MTIEEFNLVCCKFSPGSPVAALAPKGHPRDWEGQGMAAAMTEVKLWSSYVQRAGKPGSVLTWGKKKLFKDDLIQRFQYAEEKFERR